MYEIRYRSNGYDIRAYSTDLTKAKELFIAKTTAQEIEKYRIKDKKATGNLFCHIVDIWMGDSPDRLVGKVYTHFPDDFMYEQMQLVKFPIPQKA